MYIETPYYRSLTPDYTEFIYTELWLLQRLLLPFGTNEGTPDTLETPGISVLKKQRGSEGSPEPLAEKASKKVRPPQIGPFC